MYRSQRVRHNETSFLHTTDLGAHIAALGPQLVDLGLSDVRSLLSLVHLMLQLTELAQVGVGLLLL